MEPSEIEERIEFIAAMLKKYNGKTAKNKRKSKDSHSKVADASRKHISKNKIDMLFPTELKSYYASGDI